MSDEVESRRDAQLFVALVLVGVVVFSVAVTTGLLLDAQSGSLPDWVGALSTFAALLAASYAAVQTGRTLRLELTRDEQRDEDRRRSQAVLVAAWAGTIIMCGPRVTDSSGHQGTMRVTTGVAFPETIPVTIRNASDMPVWQFSVDLYLVSADGDERMLVGQHMVNNPESGLAVLGTLAPVEIMNPKLMRAWTKLLETRPRGEQLSPRIGIGWTFKDNAGQWWRRRPGEGVEPLEGTGTAVQSAHPTARSVS